MVKNHSRPLLYYGLAVFSVALALAITLALGSWLEPTPSSLFFMAVMASAWLGGLGPGLLATALSTLAINYFLFEPYYSFQVNGPKTVLQLVVFALATVLISGLNQARYSALRQAKIDLAIREQAEAALRQSDQRLQAVVANLPNGAAFVVDRALRYRLAAGKALEDVGLTPEYFLGKTLWEALEPALANDYEPYYRQALRGKPSSWEHFSHNCYYITHWVPLYGLRDEVDAVLALSYNITERKRAELNERFVSQLETQLRQLSTAEAMIKEVVSRLGEYLDVDCCLWHTVNLPEDIAVVDQEWRRQANIPSLVEEYRLSEFMPPELIDRYHANQPAVVSDVATFPDTASFAHRFTAIDVGAFLGIPCLYEGRWLALLVITSRTSQNWRPDQVVLLQEVAARLWPLIEHIRAVQHLRQNEAEFRQLANLMPQIVWVAGADGQFEFLNDRWSEYTGLTLEQSRDRSLMQTVIHPEDFASLQSIFMQAKVAQSPYQAQFRLLQPDGRQLYFLARSVPLFNAQGQIYKWYGTFTEITGLKQLEEELRQKNAILDIVNKSVPAPIFVKDRQGRIIYANPATLAVLGKTAAEVIGHRDGDLYPNPEDAARVMANDRRIMESGEMEIVEESPDGIRTFLGMKVPYRDDTGQVIGLIGISNDITERVQLERDREQVLQREQAARMAAENANRIKDEFLAVLSHELRSPLNPILGWSQLLKTGNLNPAKTAQAIEIIERNAQLQSQLIEDLLDVSRILRGKLALASALICLPRVITAALDTVRLAAEAKSIQIATDFDPNVGQVYGDAGRLQQVVWNLLSNAVKFTPAGGRVEVSLRQVNDQTQLQVSDTGKGISPEFLPAVFEHFRQEDGATTRKFGGLGLGLAIARQIVELHGGTITVESPGEDLGATFTVYLPLSKQEGGQNDLSPEPGTPLSPPAPLANLSVLVVDDELDSLTFTTFIVERAGARVTAVSSAVEALQALQRQPYAILLSDVGMPDVDGYQLMQRVRALPADQGGCIPAIALTAYAGETDQQQALEAGFQRHIAKPLDASQLIQAVVAMVK
ncbi:MAG: PAS domain-containing protein [Nodosilinea sp.]